MSLSLSPNRLSDIDDDALLLRLYRQFGAGGVSRALGAFAFAAWDEAARHLVLGRDCLGERTLFFHQGEGVVTFASDLNTLLSLPFVPRAIDEDAVANYLALNLGRPSQTFYKDIERVPSRTLVTIDPSGLRRDHYWSPDFAAPPPFKKEADYVERARELFDQAVIRAIQDTPHIAISTSGGLNSSAVAATAARLGRAQSITCYTMVPPAKVSLKIGPKNYLSERDKVEALARMHPALKVKFCEEESLHPFEENPARFFLRSGVPFLNPSLLGPFSALYGRVASDRFSVLHDGRVGNIGLTWDGRFSLLALLRTGRIHTLARDFMAASRQSGRGMVRTFVGDLFIPAASYELRQRFHRFRGRDPDSVAHYSGLAPRVARELSQSGAWRQDGFDPLFTRTGLEPAKFRARLLFGGDPFAQDIWASSRTIFDLEFRDPHGDRELLEFLLKVPEWHYQKNGVRRSFGRKVLADRLPPEIVNETRRGAQGVTWFSRLDKRRAEIGEEVERLEASPLASRLLDVPRMKRILDDWPRDAQNAQARRPEVKLAFGRGLHVGQFIRWVEGGNA